MALLNSKLLDWFFKKGSVPFRGNFYSANKQFIAPLPIRYISFTTPQVERGSLVEKLKVKYNILKFEELLTIVDECLPRDKEGNFVTEKEKSDVVHDFLAYLAEQIIEMNKKKQAEIKGFLEWLEREIEAQIDDLTNKSKIKAYHEHSFYDLLDVLKQNRKKLEVDPSRRDFQENLKAEFEKSLTKLTPLKSKIQSTDDLIDQIVYKLYGLTYEEIKIVEGETL